MVTKKRTDEEIKKDVIDTLFWDNRVDASNVLVEVQDREVVLRGTVPTFSTKEAILLDAWRIPGVIKVDNQALVKYPATVKTPSDSDIKSMIKKLLSWNDSTKTAKIDVSVKKGVVTLQGDVDAYWKKFRAQQLTSGVNGVLDLVNKISVVPTKSVVDQAIADDVTKAIDRSYALNIDDIDVRVENGVVTLYGVLPNRVTCEAALDAARHTFGVKDVVNKLAVK